MTIEFRTPEPFRNLMLGEWFTPDDENLAFKISVANAKCCCGEYQWGIEFINPEQIVRPISFISDESDFSAKQTATKTLDAPTEN